MASNYSDNHGHGGLAPGDNPAIFMGDEGPTSYPEAKHRPSPTEQSGCDADCGRPGGVLQCAIGDLNTGFLADFGKEGRTP